MQRSRQQIPREGGLTTRIKRIGVFDSGVGGLTVLSHLSQRIPTADFIYLGDLARVPYGTRSLEVVARYTGEGLSYLLRQGVDALVIACHTASTWYHLHRNIEIAVPVFDVLQPATVEAATRFGDGRIGVIGTRATIEGGVYEKLLQQLSVTGEIVTAACPLFVPLVEEGWVSGPIVELVVARYLKDMCSRRIDALILGCTHYPLLRPVIEAYVGSDVEIIEAGPPVSARVRTWITSDSEAPPEQQAGSVRLCFTAPLGSESRETLASFGLIQNWTVETVNLSDQERKDGARG